MLGACEVDDLRQVRDIARRYRLRRIAENIAHEKHKAQERGQRPTWYRVRSAIKGDWAGEARRAKAVQKVKKHRQCTTREAEEIVMQREHWRERAIDLCDELTEQQIHELLAEAIGALPDQKLRDDAIARATKLRDQGQSQSQIATNQLFARLIVERADLIRSGETRYVRDLDADTINQEPTQ